jgi:hypothetical protein
MEIRYTADDHSLHVSLFLSLVQRVWPRHYDAYFAQPALHRTLNITAWR